MQVVISFRGTASLSNVAIDSQVGTSTAQLGAIQLAACFGQQGSLLAIAGCPSWLLCRLCPALCTAWLQVWRARWPEGMGSVLLAT